MIARCMLVLIEGGYNYGKLYLSNGSHLFGRHAGPVDVLGRGRYRGEALKMDDCINCKFLEKCREGEKMPCPWETVENMYNPNI